MNIVTQKTLALLDRLDADVAAAQRRLATAKQRYGRQARPIIDALLAGALVNPGARLAAVKVHRRRSIAWRREYEAKLGADEVQRIVDQTEPKVRNELVITRRPR
jgi:hypothetical protein